MAEPQRTDVDPRRTSLLVAWILGIAGTVLASNLWWLRRNELPDGFQNEYEHFYTLTEVFFRMRDNSLSDAWAPLWEGYYPPLEHAVGSAGLLLFGRSYATPIMALGLFVVLMLVAIGWAGRALKDHRTAAVAVGLTALYPAIFGNARRYEPNVTLAAMVAIAVGVLIVRGGLLRWTTVVAVGVLVGIGMLADRLVFAVYILPVFVVLLVRAVRVGREQRVGALARLGGAATLAGLVCGYYYERFFAIHLDEITTQLGGEIAASGEVTQSLPIWSPKGLAYYPLSWLDCQMGLVLGAATIAGIGLYVFRGRRDLDRDRRALLEAWLFGGLLIVTVVSKKQPFYSIPLLAPAALAAAIGWRSLPGTGLLRGAIAAALLLAGVHQLSFLTREAGILPTPGRWSWLAGASPFPDQWLGYEYTQAAPPHRFGLDVGRMARVCAAERDRQPDLPYAVLFSPAQGAYEGQLKPTLRLALDTILVEGVLMNGPAVEEHADEASCFVYVTGSGADWPGRDEIAQEWEDWGVGVPAESMYVAMEAMQERSTLAARWSTGRFERVHVYTLVAPSDP